MDVDNRRNILIGIIGSKGKKVHLKNHKCN